ncbi:MAG: exo-alpha-sialidase, partial [Thermoanaerobaculia bacterium]
STSEVENVRVTDASSGFPFQAEPSIVVDGQGRILAGWKEMNEIGGANRIGFGRSLDGGRTWERSLVDVATPDQGQSDPWLALDELGRVYYARTQSVCRNYRECPPGLAGIAVSRFDDGGLVWGPMVNIHVQPDFADKASIQGDGNGTIYASYVTAGPSAPRNMKIIATRSLDGGVTWGPSRVVVTGLNPFAPAVTTRPNGTAHIVWWAPAGACCPGGNIMVSTSTDRGETWGSPVRVNSVSGSALFEGFTHPIRIPYPWPATKSGGSLFVAWADMGKGEYNIVVARSDDGGATWSAPAQVNDTDAGDQWMAAITVDTNDVLHAAWFDARTGNINLYYAFSTDGGRTWSPNLRVTTQETPANVLSLSEYIGLAADRNGAAHLVWTDGRDGGSAIYFARTAGLPQGPVDRLDPVPPGSRGGKPRVLPPRD